MAIRGQASCSTERTKGRFQSPLFPLISHHQTSWAWPGLGLMWLRKLCLDYKCKLVVIVLGEQFSLIDRACV